MARQPIFDRQMKVHAYELLFREHGHSETADIDKDRAAKALLNALVDIGLRQLTGQTRAYLNLSEELLLSDSISMLPKDRVVLEILETIEPSQAVIDRLRELKEAGYTIALDDFVASPQTETLLPFANVVKIDVLGRSEASLARTIHPLRLPGVLLLAEKVETGDEFRACQNLGFDLYQGFYFARPETMRGSSIPANKLAMLRLAAKLQSPAAAYNEIEQIIAEDVALSYRLLRYVKSAHFGLPDSVNSIRQALLFLGLNTVSSLAALLAMSTATRRPDELIVTALVRAKMCELLAATRKAENLEIYFTVGLLSVLDALLDAPMEEILNELPLAEEVNHALLHRDTDSELAKTIQTVVAYERGEWDLSLLAGLSGKEVADAYNLSVCWANQSGLQTAA